MFWINPIARFGISGFVAKKGGYIKNLGVFIKLQFLFNVFGACLQYLN